MVSNKFLCSKDIFQLINVYLIYFPESKQKVTKAFSLGLCVYGIYDAPNMLLFKNYTIHIDLTDMVWGGCLFALTNYLDSEL